MIIIDVLPSFPISHLQAERFNQRVSIDWIGYIAAESLIIPQSSCFAVMETAGYFATLKYVGDVSSLACPEVCV